MSARRDNSNELGQNKDCRSRIDETNQRRLLVPKGRIRNIRSSASSLKTAAPFSKRLLHDLYTDADVLLDAAQNLVVHAIRFHPIFERTEFIERTDEIVEEYDVAGFEVARERCEDVECRTEKICIEMDHQAASEIVTVDEGQQRVLKQASLE